MCRIAPVWRPSCPRRFPQAGINVDLIVQSLHEGASNDMAFTLERQDLERAQAVVGSPEAAVWGVPNPSSLPPIPNWPS